jgi:hypothetical protein
MARSSDAVTLRGANNELKEQPLSTHSVKGSRVHDGWWSTFGGTAARLTLVIC